MNRDDSDAGRHCLFLVHSHTERCSEISGGRKCTQRAGFDQSCMAISKILLFIFLDIYVFTCFFENIYLHYYIAPYAWAAGCWLMLQTGVKQAIVQTSL